MTVFTIGHSTRTLDEFVALLEAHGIRRLIDVRRYPGSRRYPHFSRETLGAQLEAAGIAYAHAPELGGRRTPSPDSPNGAWRSASFRAYADWMAEPAWQEAISAALHDAGSVAIVFMCAEAVPWRCHRQLIADALVARGIEVRHILSRATPQPHVLHPNARVGPDGQVRYPPEGTSQPELF
jgi:uncharacterized protein (DUF488 family)